MRSMRFILYVEWYKAVHYFSPPFYFTLTQSPFFARTLPHPLPQDTFLATRTRSTQPPHHQRTRPKYKETRQMKHRNKKKCTFRSMSSLNKGILTFLLIVLLCLAAGPSTANAATQAEEDRAAYGSVIGIGMFPPQMCSAQQSFYHQWI